MVSTAGTTSTPHARAERLAHLEKVFTRLRSLMSTLQDFWNEALAAGIDGKIKMCRPWSHKSSRTRARGRG